MRIADGSITATDQELTITTPIDWSGPPTLLPHQRLTAIISTISSDEVTIAADGTACTIESTGGKWRLPIEDAAEFPTVTTAVGKSIGRLPCDQFRALVGSVRFATDNETSRFALGGVLVEFCDGNMHFVASDGRRLCIASAEVDQALDNSDTLVPKRVIDVLYRLAGSSSEAIQLEASSKKIVAKIGGTVIEGTLIEGKFPRWRDVEPDRPDAKPSTAVVGNLLHACEMAAICESEASRGVTWTFTADGIFMLAKSSEFGESSATCELVEAGRPCSVKIDPRFAVEWLRTLDPAETVEVEAVDAASAVVFRAGEPVDGVHPLRNVVMPLAKD